MGMNSEDIFFKNYYLRLKNTSPKYPWEREWGHEYFRYEEKRINEVKKWADRNLVPSNNRKKINDPVSFYAVPIEPSSYQKVQIATYDEGKNYNYIGLSALRNSPNMPYIGLISSDKKIPKEYRLINITESKMGILMYEKGKNTGFDIIIIEDWEYLPSDTVYLDVPYEKRIVYNILNETLNDKELATSFQLPIISSPKDTVKGGISLSSISEKSSFSDELIKTIQLMVPPEYRNILPPKKAYQGNSLIWNGFKIHSAERPYSDSHFLEAKKLNEYTEIENLLLERNRFNGEYSIFSTVEINKGNYLNTWKGLLFRFTATEVTMPTSLTQYESSDYDLRELQKSIDEDLWLQIVNKAQCMPYIDEKENKNIVETIQDLKKSLDVLLSGVHRNSDDREFLVKYMLADIEGNCKRLTRSFARTEDRERVTKNDMKKTRNLIVDNFSGFTNNPYVNRIMWKIKSKDQDIRISLVRTCLSSNPYIDLKEIYEQVKSTQVFRDFLELQTTLDIMYSYGLVSRDVRGRYVLL